MIANVMLDLETTGSAPSSAILEIGACVFSSSRGIVKEFSTLISLDSCKEFGLTQDLETLEWWNKQPEDLKKRVFSGKKTLKKALWEFREWMPWPSIVWGNGSDFDNVILSNAYRAIGSKRPWPAFNDRCFRTMKNVFKDVKKPKRKSTKHIAVEDAKYQAEWLIKIYNERIAK